MATFIVLMGPPGAGKGTQAKRLQSELSLPQISTGDIFRDNLRRETELGKLAKSYMEAGELVPDEVTNAMVRDRLARDDAAQGAIMDGYPRSPAQAAAFEKMLAQMGEQVNVVPVIEVDQEELVRRLLQRAELEGRADDNEDTIRTRMRVYQEQTAPLIEFYEKRGLVRRVDGEQSIDDVSKNLLSLVRECSPELRS